MPLVYLNSDAQPYPSAMPETGSRSQGYFHGTEGSTKSFLGFTPPDQNGSQLLRARKSKSRKAALRGVGADGGGAN